MQSPYLKSLPQKFIRGVAGFQRQDNYYLPRVKVAPSDCLLSLVFLDADGWMGHFIGIGEEVESDLAGQGFLRLLQELRTVFLQDSALLRKEFPEHPLWKHALFALPEYKAFTLAVVKTNDEREKPLNVQLRNVLPIVAERLATSRSRQLLCTFGV